MNPIINFEDTVELLPFDVDIFEGPKPKPFVFSPPPGYYDRPQPYRCAEFSMKGNPMKSLDDTDPIPILQLIAIDNSLFDILKDNREQEEEVSANTGGHSKKAQVSAKKRAKAFCFNSIFEVRTYECDGLPNEVSKTLSSFRNNPSFGPLPGRDPNARGHASYKKSCRFNDNTKKSVQVQTVAAGAQTTAAESQAAPTAAVNEAASLSALPTKDPKALVHADDDTSQATKENAEEETVAASPAKEAASSLPLDEVASAASTSAPVKEAVKDASLPLLITPDTVNFFEKENAVPGTPPCMKKRAKRRLVNLFREANTAHASETNEAFTSSASPCVVESAKILSTAKNLDFSLCTVEPAADTASKRLDGVKRASNEEASNAPAAKRHCFRDADFVFNTTAAVVSTNPTSSAVTDISADMEIDEDEVASVGPSKPFVAEEKKENAPSTTSHKGGRGKSRAAAKGSAAEEETKKVAKKAPGKSNKKVNKPNDTSKSATEAWAGRLRTRKAATVKN